MMTVALVAGLTLVILPHSLDLRRAAPARAAALWLGSLVARAATVVLVIGWLIVFLPGSDPFAAVTQWCWHAVVPYVAAHIQLTGHGLGDAALLVPALAVGVSAVATVHGVIRATGAVREYLRRFAMGPGPAGSVIVPGPEILLAAAGIARPRVLVSAGALLQLDDDELAAGLEHERAHIARRHRWLLLAGALGRAAGRPVPGSAQALRELGFHLERDADRWAVRKLNDRQALASVICKAATSAPTTGGMAALGGADVAARVRELVDEPATGVRSRRSTAGRMLAVCIVAWLLGSTATTAAAVALPAASGGVIECAA